MIRPANFVPKTATAPQAMITSEPITNVQPLPAMVVDASTHDE